MEIETASREQLVTELLAARRRLAELESLFAEQQGIAAEGERAAHLAVHSAPILLFATDHQGVVTSAAGRLIHDPGVVRALGPDPPKMVGRSLFELVPDPDQMADRFARALNGETTVAIDERAGRTVESRLAPLRGSAGEITGAIGMAYDLTGRVLAEEAQRYCEKRYRDLFNGVPVGLYQTTPEGTIIDANPALADMLGPGDPAALIHRNAADFYVDPLDRDSWREEIESQGVVRAFEFQLRRTDGRVIWARDSAHVVRDERGQVLYYEGILEDVTDRRWADEMFAHLAFLVRSTDDAIVAADLDSTIRTWNPAAERIYGYSADEARGQSIIMLTLPEERPEILEILGRIKLGERIDHFDMVQVRKDGSRVDVSLTMSPIVESSGVITGASIIARDVTEQKKMHQQMIRAEQLVAMGYVAATLAHEIRNPLQVLQSNLELVLDFPLGPDERQDALRLCLQETERIAGITRRVLNLARTDGQDTRPVSLLSLVRQMHGLLAQSLQEANIGVIIDLAEDLPAVVASPGQIVQVLVNIVVNAIEALEHGGTITITAAVEGEMVALTLANDGPSIEPEVLAQIFDPFFTTRTQGTGLGLFVSYNIVQQHGGRMMVENLAGGGVAFTLTLPVFPGRDQTDWADE